MIRLLIRKQIYTEGGYMLDSNNILIGVFGLLGGMFGMMLSFYILLSMVQWISDVIDEKRWQEWRYWFND